MTQINESTAIKLFGTTICPSECKVSAMDAVCCQASEKSEIMDGRDQSVTLMNKKLSNLNSNEEHIVDTDSGGQEEEVFKKPDKILPCPRCYSEDTKFCYFNNYNVNQPRHYCRKCQRYWTAGGTMRNVPTRTGRRKNKEPSTIQGQNSKLAYRKIIKPVREEDDSHFCKSGEMVLDFQDQQRANENNSIKFRENHNQTYHPIPSSRLPSNLDYNNATNTTLMGSSGQNWPSLIRNINVGGTDNGSSTLGKHYRDSGLFENEKLGKVSRIDDPDMALQSSSD